jgi:hypothetical protein
MSRRALTGYYFVGRITCSEVEAFLLCLISFLPDAPKDPASRSADTQTKGVFADGGLRNVPWFLHTSRVQKSRRKALVSGRPHKNPSS